MAAWKELLDAEGYSLGDVQDLMDKKREELEKKKYVINKEPLGGRRKWPTGKFITLVQRSYPIKMFVFREIFHPTNPAKREFRIGYYVVSLKKLKKDGKLSLMWGQFNPMYPEDDFVALLSEARERGILPSSS